jgi:DeoR/GlpR family transcriptional regulator of sugar metabolism
VIGSSQQRRERILAHVLKQRHVTAKDLAAQVDASEATVRRDLRALADQGELELVYGGATLRRVSDVSFDSKGRRNIEAKRTIGRLAAEIVVDNDQIFIDSGTTCYELATLLNRKRGLSVIVNSARVAMELTGPGLGVIMLGGQYRPDRMDTGGPLAVSTLDQLRGYQCFIGADGLSMDFGLSAADIDSAHLYRRAVHNGRETILLVDHSKFDTPSLFKIVDWEAVSRVVTDSEPPPRWMEFFASRGIGVISPTAPAAADSSAGPDVASDAPAATEPHGN